MHGTYLNSLTSHSASTSGGLCAHRASRGPHAWSRTGPCLTLFVLGDEMITAANSLLLPRLCCTCKMRSYLKEETYFKLRNHSGGKRSGSGPGG